RRVRDRQRGRAGRPPRTGACGRAERRRPARAAAAPHEPRGHLPLADDGGARRGGTTGGGGAVTNVLAIAQKELRSYFASPIAYIIIGFFALLFGFFFTSILDWFMRQGMQMSMMGMGPQNMNVNQQMIRPLFLNVSVLLLFILPFLTARSYAEEKRTGTVELLL